MYNSMSKILTLALPSDVYDEIYRLSEKTGKSKNELIRKVLVEQYGKKANELMKKDDVVKVTSIDDIPVNSDGELQFEGEEIESED